MSRREIIAAAAVVIVLVVLAIVIFGGGGGGNDTTAADATANTATQSATSTETTPSEPQAGATGPKIDTSKPGVKPPGKGPGLYTFFNADKQNIGCEVTSVKARCEILKFNWKPPPKPASCDFNFGGSITAFPTAETEFTCEIDTALGTPASTLKTGTYYTTGPFICSAQSGGVVCKSLKTGHGFLISKKRYQIF